MTSTIRPVLTELGYDTPTQQRAFVKLAHMAGCYGELPVPGMLTDAQAEQILNNVTFDSAKDAAQWLHGSTQHFMIRRPLGGERVHTEEPEVYQKYRDGMMSAIDDLGALAPVMPKAQNYDHVLLLGAMEEAVDGRINTLKNLYDRGVRFGDIALLGSQRQLMPEHEQSATMLAQAGLPLTETAMMEQKFLSASESWPAELQNTRTLTVETFQKKDGTRSNTEENTASWLKTKPTPGSVLVISNQPYVDFQDAAVKSVLPAGYSVETVGSPASAECVKVSNALDSVARRINVGMPQLMERLKGAEAAGLIADHVDMIDPMTIRTDPARFQYRSGGDEKSGTVADHKRGGDWNPLIDGEIMLVWECKGGHRFVVDGHHRLEKAQGLRAQGQGPASVPARIIRELDGYTANDAKAIGAYRNFIKEFTASSEPKTEQEMIDAAKVFHDVAHGKVHANKLPVIQMSDELKVAQTAGTLGEKAFTLVAAGIVPVDAAAEIATRVHNPEQQYQAIELVRKRLPKDVPEVEAAPLAEPIPCHCPDKAAIPSMAVRGNKVWVERVQQSAGQGVGLNI